MVCIIIIFIMMRGASLIIFMIYNNIVVVVVWLCGGGCVEKIRTSTRVFCIWNFIYIYTTTNNIIYGI